MFSRLSNRNTLGKPLRFRSANMAGLVKAPFGPIDKTDLVGWWDSRKTGEVAIEGTWNDASGLGNHGELNDDAYVGANGLVVDGSGDYCEVISSDLHLTNKMTLMAWAKFGGNGIGNSHVISRQYGNSLSYSLTKMSNGRVSVGLNIGGWSDYLGSTYLELHTWYHMAFTYDGTNIKIYINGVLNATHYKSGVTASNPMERVWFGADANYPGWKEWTDAHIDDIQAYKRVLDGAEILANYENNMRPLI